MQSLHLGEIQRSLNTSRTVFQTRSKIGLPPYRGAPADGKPMEHRDTGSSSHRCSPIVQEGRNARNEARDALQVEEGQMEGS